MFNFEVILKILVWKPGVLCSWLIRKQLNMKINYLHVLTSQLVCKFLADPKKDLKKFHTI
jgi:hypothetical protein